jgi:hypothetical protein
VATFISNGILQNEKEIERRGKKERCERKREIRKKEEKETNK